MGGLQSERTGGMCGHMDQTMDHGPWTADAGSTTRRWLHWCANLLSDCTDLGVLLAAKKGCGLEDELCISFLFFIFLLLLAQVKCPQNVRLRPVLAVGIRPQRPLSLIPQRSSPLLLVRWDARS